MTWFQVKVPDSAKAILSEVCVCVGCVCGLCVCVCVCVCAWVDFVCVCVCVLFNGVYEPMRCCLSTKTCCVILVGKSLVLTPTINFYEPNGTCRW